MKAHDDMIQPTVRCKNTVLSLIVFSTNRHWLRRGACMTKQSKVKKFSVSKAIAAGTSSTDPSSGHILMAVP